MVPTAKILPLSYTITPVLEVGWPGGSRAVLKISVKGEVKGTTLTGIHARTPDILGFWVAASSQSYEVVWLDQLLVTEKGK